MNNIISNGRATNPCGQGRTFRMNIATALNSRYMRYTCVMLTSLFLNQENSDIHVYLLHSDLTEQDKSHLLDTAEKYHQNIHFLEINRDAFPDSLPTTSMWSLETYYRLMLLDVLPPEIDRILYLDVDMIVDKSLREIYCTDFEGNYFCACRDMVTSFPCPDVRNIIFQEHIARGFTYFNSGFMLWNISELRGQYSFKDYMKLAEVLHYQLRAPDQDLLNFMHWGQIKFVDEYQYDLFSLTAYNGGVRYEDVKRETTIIHYAGTKPWEGECVHYDIEQLWWDYAKLTPFYCEMMEEFLYNCTNNPFVYTILNKLLEDKKKLTDDLNKSIASCQKLLELVENNKKQP